MLLLSSCSAVSIVRPSSCLAVEHVVMLVGGFVLQLLFGDCLVLGSDWAQTRSSSCLAAGCNRNGVVLLVGDFVQAVAVFERDCVALGL